MTPPSLCEAGEENLDPANGVLEVELQYLRGESRPISLVHGDVNATDVEQLLSAGVLFVDGLA